MDNSAIIALQEVSSVWTGRIISLCQAADYTYIPTLYGKQFNGYMGVGIAVPNSKFRILECSIQKISESIEFQRPLVVKSVFMRAVKAPFRFLASLASFLWRETGISSILSMVFAKKAKKTLTGDAIWREALRRENLLVSLRLQDKASGGRLCVSNYHMPCAFWSPPVMMIHTALTAQHAQVGLLCFRILLVVLLMLCALCWLHAVVRKCRPIGTRG